MSDAKFLGLCIAFGAIIISATLIWSTSILKAALTNPPQKDTATTAALSPAETTVKIDGPVTLAPFVAPIPVVLTNTDENPVIVKQKDAPEKMWHRN